jgi:LmbE family N-acetylglucosaminyl deacetylase
MIRTEELLAARRIDGGKQYFTRAYDFGFSKSLDETLKRWPHDAILAQMVDVVRAFRPHIIVNVWTGTPADGHGHHQYAGVLGREVFDAAADSVRFPRGSFGAPWSVAKFYRGRRANGNLQFNVGEFDPLTGRSYSEIATESRSQHRSQGQGALPQAGPRMDGVQLEVSRVSDVTKPETTLFSGIDTSWARFASLALPDSARRALDSLPVVERAVSASMNLTDPSRMVAPLAAYVRLTRQVAPYSLCGVLLPCTQQTADLSASLSTVGARATAALLAAAGIRIELTAPREVVAKGEVLAVEFAIYNQGKLSIETGTVVDETKDIAFTPRVIPPDSVLRGTVGFPGRTLTGAWWLTRERSPRFDVFSGPPIGVPAYEDMFRSGLSLWLKVGGTPLNVPVGPIVYRRADAVLGEVRRPVATVPKISVTLDNTIEYARAAVPFDRTYRVQLRSAASTPETLSVSLRLPKGVNADTAIRRVSLAPFASTNVFFRVRGQLAAGRDSIVAIATDTRGQKFDTGYVAIEYDHIRPLRYYRPASVKLEAVNLTFANLNVGYIRGVGDNVRPMLEELGIPVTELDPQTLARTALRQFSTIVVGPRAYEANPTVMNPVTPLLMRFARDGGTVVTQYGQFEMTQQPGPLPYAIAFAGRAADRVTDETAPVRVLDTGSPLLSHPNKISAEDFNGWVQERSLYMPRTFDAQWRALFSMNDPGEPPNDGAVLVAPVGKGVYVYTTMSFFRQLPAGHPGAAKLFINLLSADPRAATRPSVRSQTPRP